MTLPYAVLQFAQATEGGMDCEGGTVDPRIGLIWKRLQVADAGGYQSGHQPLVELGLHRYMCVAFPVYVRLLVFIYSIDELDALKLKYDFINGDKKVP